MAAQLCLPPGPEISVTVIASCQLCQFPPPLVQHIIPLLVVSVLAIQAKKKRKNPKGRKGKGPDGDNAAAGAGRDGGGGGMTSSRSGDVGPNAASGGRQFR